VETLETLDRARTFIENVEKLELENLAVKKSKEKLEASINEIASKNRENREALDIATHAIEILREVSDEAVGKAYRFLEQSLNSALSKMFAETTRKIELKEFTRSGQYPQLKLVLHVGNGKTRSLRNDSGHGLAQIVSLLSILSLIVITGSRRILIVDEVISGVDAKNREIISDILWTFTEIGFQFIVNEHGFIPKGAKVYHLEMIGDVSNVKESYVAGSGLYLSDFQKNMGLEEEYNED